MKDNSPEPEDTWVLEVRRRSVTSGATVGRLCSRVPSVPKGRTRPQTLREGMHPPLLGQFAGQYMFDFAEN